MDANTDKRIEIAAALLGYPKASLTFVIDCIASLEIYADHSIDEESLCWRLHDHAIRLYGDNARNQLAKWGIHFTSDFGKIVIGLIDHEILSASDSDQLVDFENLFEFNDHFTQTKFVLQAKASQIRPSQWNLTTIFLLTTLAAIGAAGFARGGLQGAMQAIISTWILILGVTCLAIGVTDRNSSSLILIAVGIGFLTVGLFSYYGFP